MNSILDLEEEKQIELVPDLFQLDGLDYTKTLHTELPRAHNAATFQNEEEAYEAYVFIISKYMRINHVDNKIIHKNGDSFKKTTAAAFLKSNIYKFNFKIKNDEKCIQKHFTLENIALDPRVTYRYINTHAYNKNENPYDINMFTGWPGEILDENEISEDEKESSIFKTFIFERICIKDQKLFEFFMKVLAQMRFGSNRAIGVFIYIIGTGKNGKNFLGNMLKKYVFGLENVKELNNFGDLYPWNDALTEGTIFFFKELEEKHSMTSKILSQMKTNFMDDSILIKERNQNDRHIVNDKGFMGFSNFEEIVPRGGKDSVNTKTRFVPYRMNDELFTGEQADKIEESLKSERARNLFLTDLKKYHDPYFRAFENIPNSTFIKKMDDNLTADERFLSDIINGQLQCKKYCEIDEKYLKISGEVSLHKLWKTKANENKNMSRTKLQELFKKYGAEKGVTKKKNRSQCWAIKLEKLKPLLEEGNYFHIKQEDDEEDESD